MKLFFVTNQLTKLADRESFILQSVKPALLAYPGVEEVLEPDAADAILMQEEKTTFKEFRYINKLLQDAFVGRHLTKIFTICTDDSATGLLRGLYTSMPSYRFDPRFHRIVPFFEFANKLVFCDQPETEPAYLAGWYGNTRSNKLRRRLVELFKDDPRFFVRTSQSWYNHKDDEHKAYVDLIKNCKFSLCPAGWAPSSLRIYESMALGRCPVIIADHFARPIGPKWEEFALFYSPQKGLEGLPVFLQKYEPEFSCRGEKARENWAQFFEGDLLKQYYAKSLVKLISSTSAYTKEEEIRRWKSFSTYWNNRWTMPQRVANKFRFFFFRNGSVTPSGNRTFR